jgi:hypothetical protein
MCITSLLYFGSNYQILKCQQSKTRKFGTASKFFLQKSSRCYFLGDIVSFFIIIPPVSLGHSSIPTWQPAASGASTVCSLGSQYSPSPLLSTVPAHLSTVPAPPQYGPSPRQYRTVPAPARATSTPSPQQSWRQHNTGWEVHMGGGGQWRLSDKGTCSMGHFSVAGEVKTKEWQRILQGEVFL